MDTDTTGASIAYRLWGKTNERGVASREDVWNYHPLICHMIDVALVAKVWMREALWIEKRFQVFAPAIDPAQLRSIVLVLVALHDLGKAFRYFQAKSERGWDEGYGSLGKVRSQAFKPGFDHGLHGISAFTTAGLDASWNRWLPQIAATAAHHGSFHSAAAQYNAAVPSFECSAIREIVTAVLTINEAPQVAPAPPQGSQFALLLAGLTSVSDWIGSNSQEFPFHPGVSRETIRQYSENPESSERISEVLHAFGLIPEFSRKYYSFADLFPFIRDEGSLLPLQASSMEIEYGIADGPELLIVEAPMGTGKTEIALHATAQAIRNGTVSGYYFALPTQASSNAMMARLADFSTRIGKTDATVSFVLAHGSRTINPQYQRLLRSFLEAAGTGNRDGGQTSTDGYPAEVVAPDWLQNTKRILLATAGVGTVDQAMLGAMNVRHNFVRLFALAGKVVIFDEIHSYDVYMGVVITRLLQWLSVLGTKVIMMSATLPPELRGDIVSAYAPESSTDPLLESVAYPQLLHVSDGKSSVISPRPDASPSKQVRIKTRVLTGHNGEISGDQIEYVLSLMKKGGCVAWIRNTVRDAQEAWRALLPYAASEAGFELRHFHSRFTLADRSAIEQEIMRSLGKNAVDSRPSRMLIIATQVMEQSVDLDVDAMISDLAPVDLLLQRMGRLWRHNRPVAERQGHREPVFEVLLPDEEHRRKLDFGRSGYVYDAEILARSAVLINRDEHWSFPAHCRSLVADLYDESIWDEHKLDVEKTHLDQKRVEAQARRQARQARSGTMLFLSPDGNLLPVSPATSDSPYGEGVEAATRDGTRSIQLTLLIEREGTLRFIAEPDLVIFPFLGTNPDQQVLLQTAMIRSAVPTPWYFGELPKTDMANPNLRAVAQLWQNLFPCDDRVFVLLEADGRIEHPAFEASYHSGNAITGKEGLVMKPLKTAHRSSSM